MHVLQLAGRGMVPRAASAVGSHRREVALAPWHPGSVSQRAPDRRHDRQHRGAPTSQPQFFWAPGAAMADGPPLLERDTLFRR